MTRPIARITVSGVIRLVVLVAVAVASVLPLIWLFLAPTKTDAQLVNGSPLAFGSLSRVATAWSHVAGYENGVVYKWLANSIWYTGVTVVLATVTAVMAGYALATTRMRGRRVVLFVTLIGMIVPPAALVLPLFLEINAVKLTNTAWSVILPSSVYPFGVYLAFVFFSTTLPKGILEAARIDGCSEYRAFVSVALPLARPLVAMLVFFAFVANWTNYFLPYVLLSDESKYPLQVGLGAMIAGTPALNPSMGQSYVPIHRPEVALVGLLTVVPIILVFAFAQKYLVRGILAGALKS